MTTVEVESYEAEKYKELWLEAKKRNSEVSALNDDLRRQIKTAQDEAAKALESAGEADAIGKERDEAVALLETLENEVKSLSNQLKKARAEAEAAKKTAAARAEEAQRAAENSTSESAELRAQVEELATSAEEANAEKTKIEHQLKEAQKRIAAAQKIAEGIAELG